MTCERVYVGGDAFAILCNRSRGTPKCKSCGKHGAPKLCDYNLGDGKTCDARCCSECAEHVGHDRDYCPAHRTKENPVAKLKPPPSAEIAQSIADKAATFLVLDVGQKRVDAAALSKTAKFAKAAIVEDRRRCVAWYRSNVAVLAKHLGWEEGECSSCKAKIWWTVNANGKKVPISVDGLNHFADCAHAKLHRKNAKPCEECGGCNPQNPGHQEGCSKA